MNLIHSHSTQSAIDTALGLVSRAAASAVDDTAKVLDGQVTAVATMRAPGRDAIISAHNDLGHQVPIFLKVFNDALREKIMLEFAGRDESRRQSASTNWESLSLVEDGVVEERLWSDRIGQCISEACEAVLRDLARYTGALLPPGRADRNPNPFRPEVLAAALYSAIEAVASERESRKVLARELSPLIAKHMRSCYDEMVLGLKSGGVQAVSMAVRGVDGLGSDRAAKGLPRDAQHSKESALGNSSEGGLDTGSTAIRNSTRSGGLDSSGLARLPWAAGGNRPWVSRPYSSGGQAPVADAELMSLIRHLAAVSSQTGDPAGGETRVASSFGAMLGTDGGAGLAQDMGDMRGDSLNGLMAVNLIRAHRDELRRASNGTIEHMVIDVVASLFDQILSDSRVPPQMARQIGRLQLPVLRVALSDSSFFSTRKHPVRRFVNRLASLACAFDDFEDGPGKQFLARVRDLVHEIIEGEFDQVDTYTEKLNLLEAFIEQQTRAEIQSNGAATLLEGKESELLVQQRYMQQLRTAMTPLEVPDYLRDFLSQVWSQALVLVTRRDGPKAERPLRMRRAACDLVMSIQPKETSALRKAFLTNLPRLMKDLNEGLKLIGWPDAAQKEFFARLLPAHSESLRAKGQSELERNLLAKQVEAVFSAPVPSGGQLAVGTAPELEGETIKSRFSVEEAQQIGLLAETAVDWDGQVDIDLGVDEQEADESIDARTEHEQLDLGQGLNLNTSPAEPVEPSRGMELMRYLKVGIAYQMHLKDKWQKVRLNYVSKGRGFFVFTHGSKHQETVSLTSRMLARMCETGRMRAFESNQLLERATVRARKQLAAIKASSLADCPPLLVAAQAA